MNLSLLEGAVWCLTRLLSIPRRLNDSRHWRDDGHRTSVMLPYVERFARCARNDARDLQCMYALADYAVRVIAAEAMDRCKLPEQAQALRALPPVVDRASALVARDAARKARAYAAADAAAADAAYAADAAADAAAAAAAADAAADADAAAADAAAYAAAYAAYAYDAAYAADADAAAAAAAYAADAAAYAAYAYAAAYAADAAAAAAKKSGAETIERHTRAMLDIICVQYAV